MPTAAPAKSPAKSSSKARPTKGVVRLLIGTEKGAFFAQSDKDRAHWTLSPPTMLGTIVSHLVADPRDPKTLLMAASTGHLGPTIFRSNDSGKTWTEAKTPPAFPKVKECEAPGLTVKKTFWLTPGHASEPNVWYAGTAPFGLFRSEDGGKTWKGVKGFNDDPAIGSMRAFETPGGALTHSISIDPRDPKHMYLGLSVGGIFETTDGGKKWKPLNKGVVSDFLPPGEHEMGQDPHCLMVAPSNPDILYHQNHCGIYRLDRPGVVWDRIGDNMPRAVGDVGFPITIHPRDPETAWVLPMDGTAVWPRTSPGGRPALYVTRDGGKSWKAQTKGLPKENAHLTVYRQSLAMDHHDPVGLYFGTTAGELYASTDEGASWKLIGKHLPKIVAVEVG